MTDTSHEWRPLLLGLAVMLFLADMLLALWLRGLFSAFSASTATLVLLLCVPHTANAADGIAMTEKTWLGVISNGAGDQQSTASMGLAALADRLMQKTAIDDIGVAKVNLETDDLTFYPFLYWPLERDPQLSTAAIQKIQDYFTHGGMVLINLVGQAQHNPALTQSGIELPLLKQVEADHPLLRTFYLLNECSGRIDGEMWSERDVSGRQDGVPAVFVGNRDWAAAWAGATRGRFEQEWAMRCGVNLVIYAMTGNYKTDQVHVTAILDRLKQ